MGSSAMSQLQASAAQAITDLGTSKHQNQESSFLSGNDPAAKRARIGEDEGENRSAPNQHLPAPLTDQGHRSIAT